MYSPVRTQHLSSRLTAVKAVTAATAPTLTLSVGTKDVVATKSSTGKVAFAPAEPFRRTPVVVASPIDGAIGDFARVTAQSVSAYSIENMDTGNAASEGTVEALCLGFDSDCEDIVQGLSLANTNGYDPELIGIYYVSSALTIGAGRVSVTNTGGVLEFVFKEPFQKEPIVVASAITGFPRVTNKSVSGFTVEAYDEDGAILATPVISIIVLGWHNPELSYGRASDVHSRRQDCVVKVGIIDGTAATQALTEGENDFTLTVSNIGRYYVVSKEKADAAKSGVVVASAKTGAVCAYESSGKIYLNVVDASGVAIDDVVNFIHIYFPNTEEY